MNQTIYWGAIILDSFKYLANDDLKASDYKTLFYLMSKINYTNNIASVKQKTISDDLSMHKSSISKSISNLENLQYIVKADQLSGYMVNPNIFYVGKSNAMERRQIRINFDFLLSQNGIEPRFSMLELEGKLLSNIDEETSQLNIFEW